jgi:hypothetical protein
MFRKIFVQPSSPLRNRIAVIILVIMVIHAVPIVWLVVRNQMILQQQLGQVEADYSQLERLLSEGQWKAADQKTAEIMLKLTKNLTTSDFTYDSLETLPCSDLRRIDQLWVKYSNGRFGFRVQQRIWQEVGGQPNYETAVKLSQRVGWSVKDRALLSGQPLSEILQFNRNAPLGHLPVINRSVTSVTPPKGLGYMHGFLIEGTWFSPGANYVPINFVTHCDL